VTRRDLLRTALPLTASALAAPPPAKPWPLGINTYCLRFQRWNDRRLFDYCAEQKLDSIFLQDSLDPAAQDPKHWAEVRAWSREMNLPSKPAAALSLPKTAADRPQIVATLRKNMSAPAAMAPLVRALLASDRYAMPPAPSNSTSKPPPVSCAKCAHRPSTPALKSASRIAKELQAWETRAPLRPPERVRRVYLDTGNPSSSLKIP
jgi:hypothetical protein